ncbi:exonuclease domain-containing protein [Roseospira visakhapatnamensis]|uniref:DNA polymerase-3 subunit epsilon n=1 Tax=Roseospira visakhapatnamensis TaxID=390880 RepID=A0A7W6WA88_9PROT|nr:exonuclease domain-containing protein [Roseospira visakhapatnamensis]MBB4266222.1 DNA polymerase-3 subunit epsilon [Roseospira visakhapatnamensis]
MLRHLIGTDMARKILWLRCRPGPLKDYYAVDYPTLDTPWSAVEFLAIDLETTGLNPEQDEIISIGYAPVRRGAVVFSESGHHLARPTRPVPEESAVIHGLLDRHLQAAPPLETVLPRVLRAMTGRVPVAHFADVERGFLDAACRRLLGHPLLVPYVDTLRIEKRVLERRQDAITRGALRLNAARERYNLPRYKAHDARLDAIGAGELFLAQVAHMDTKKPPRLEEVITG